MRENILYVVIPCYNEEEVLPETARQLKEKMTSLMERGLIARDSRIVFVNDGSKGPAPGPLSGSFMSRTPCMPASISPGTVAIRTPCWRG